MMKNITTFLAIAAVSFFVYILMKPVDQQIDHPKGIYMCTYPVEETTVYAEYYYNPNTQKAFVLINPFEYKGPWEIFFPNHSHNVGGWGTFSQGSVLILTDPQAKNPPTYLDINVPNEMYNYEEFCAWFDNNIEIQKALEPYKLEGIPL